MPTTSGGRAWLRAGVGPTIASSAMIGSSTRERTRTRRSSTIPALYLSEVRRSSANGEARRARRIRRRVDAVQARAARRASLHAEAQDGRLADRALGETH